MNKRQSSGRQHTGPANTVGPHHHTHTDTQTHIHTHTRVGWETAHRPSLTSPHHIHTDLPPPLLVSCMQPFSKQPSKAELQPNVTDDPKDFQFQGTTLDARCVLCCGC